MGFKINIWETHCFFFFYLLFLKFRDHNFSASLCHCKINSSKSKKILYLIIFHVSQCISTYIYYFHPIIAIHNSNVSHLTFLAILIQIETFISSMKNKNEKNENSIWNYFQSTCKKYSNSKIIRKIIKFKS